MREQHLCIFVAQYLNCGYADPTRTRSAFLYTTLSHCQLQTCVLGIKPCLCLQEFDFVLSDMALEVIGDFAVVWLLSPTRSFSPVAKNSMARYINGLPGHALQVCPLYG